MRAEIEQTRAELGDTVAALAEKTDVKGQAKQAVDEAKATVRAKVTEIRESTGERVGAAHEATPASVSEARERMSSFAQENRAPLIAAGLFALGLLVGRRSAR